MKVNEMIAYAVIGANYGDEGKGIITDVLADTLQRNGHDVWNVRFNGGAQAGHTVCTPDGKRHVFSHLGAATFLGVPTFLGPRFISNPILYAQERDKLNKMYMRGLPGLFADPRGLITTPWDMMLNQFVERRRAEEEGTPHGSVGVGINETIVRSVQPNFRLSIDFITHNSTAVVQGRLAYILSKWVPMRLVQLGFKRSTTQHAEALGLMQVPALLHNYMLDLFYFRGALKLNEPYELFTPESAFVFEGAQGLGLDEMSPNYPHVTRSRTGLPYVLDMIRDYIPVEKLNVQYVTRTYTTRHGAGPLKKEDPALRYQDDTNVAHPFQGPLRFAPLDYPSMKARIQQDMKVGNSSGVNCEYHVAVTHCDQSTTKPQKIAEALGLPCVLTTFGPTRKDAWPLQHEDHSSKQQVAG